MRTAYCSIRHGAVGRHGLHVGDWFAACHAAHTTVQTWGSSPMVGAPLQHMGVLLAWQHWKTVESSARFVGGSSECQLSRLAHVRAPVFCPQPGRALHHRATHQLHHALAPNLSGPIGGVAGGVVLPPHGGIWRPQPKAHTVVGDSVFFVDLGAHAVTRGTTCSATDARLGHHAALDKRCRQGTSARGHRLARHAGQIIMPVCCLCVRALLCASVVPTRQLMETV